MISSGWSQAATTLKDAAAAAGINIGVATNSFNVSNATYAAAVKAQFNTVVCENETKWESTERSRGSFSYSGSDQVAKFATDNNMKMRGHTFVWHSQSGYASSVTNKATLIADMENHIDKVGTHFKGKIYEWDVLNEITADGSGGLRNSFWRNVIGDDFPDLALKKAREVLGNTTYLVYNDYGGDGVNTKSTSMFNLVKKWQAAKTPIDGIGLQCHLNSPINKQNISDNIKRFGELGIRISLTEIDIKNGTSQDWVNLLNACLENFNCLTFVAWGLADGNSWLGSNCNCLLYSGSANSPTPKAHIQAMITALNAADPAITAKRKEFAARAPGGGGVAIHHLATPKAGKAPAATLFGAAAVPVFTTKNGAVVDIQGRNRLPVLNAGPDGLRLEAR